MKKKMMLLLIGLICLSCAIQTVHSETMTNQGKLKASLSQTEEGALKERFSKLRKKIVTTYNLTYEGFVKEFIYMKECEPSLSVADYASRYNGLIGKTGRSIGDRSWRRNIGTDVKNLTFKSVPNYDTYGLLDMGLRKGDIIYEGNGGNTFTGHTAMVDDIVTETHLIKGKKKTFTYVRLIDAMTDGVVYSVLDDTRAEKQNSVVLRPKEVTAQQMRQAFSFVKSQLGKPYNLNIGNRNASRNRKDWYCSVLLWAAYKDIGLDIESRANGAWYNEPGVTPRDIRYSSAVAVFDHKFKLSNRNDVKNLTISEKSNRANNEDLAYEKSNPNYYRLYNNYYVLEKQKDGKYRAQTSLYLGGDYYRSADRHLLGGLYEIEMTASAKAHFKGYNYNVGRNRDANYAFQWINYWSTSEISIIYSENIKADVMSLNEGKAEVSQGLNDKGQEVSRVS